MSNKVKSIPDGYHVVTPYLFIQGAAQAMEFYKNVFNAREVFRAPGPDGKVGHAEMILGDSKIMLADEVPNMRALGPRTIGGTPVMIHLYVENVDAVAKKAAEFGAKIVQPVSDKFYGDRSGTLEDPWGHLWGIATHIEDVSFEELARRAAAAGKGSGPSHSS